MAICPHCGNIITATKDIRFKRLTGAGTIAVDGHPSGDIVVVSCAVCDKILGIE